MASQLDLDELLALQLALQSNPDDVYAIAPEFAEAGFEISIRPEYEARSTIQSGNDEDVVTASLDASNSNHPVDYAGEVPRQADSALATAVGHRGHFEAEAVSPLLSQDDGQPSSSTNHYPPTYSEAVNASHEYLSQHSLPLPPQSEPDYTAASNAQIDIDHALALALHYDDNDDDVMFGMTDGASSSSSKGRGELAIFKRYNSQGIKTRPTTRKLLPPLNRPIQALTQRGSKSRPQNENNKAPQEASVRSRFLQHLPSRVSLLMSAASPALPGQKQSECLLLTLLNDDMLYEIVSFLCFPDAFSLAFTCRTLNQHMAPWLPGIKKGYIRSLALINTRLAKKHRVAFCSVCCYLLDEESLLSDGRDIDAATGLRRCAQCRDLVRGKEKLRLREAGQSDEDDEEEYSLLPVWRTSTRKWDESLWYRDTVLGEEEPPWQVPEIVDR